MKLNSWDSVLTERDVGSKIRKELEDTIRALGRVDVDFSEVIMINSSFADEVFGKLVRDLGVQRAQQCIQLINISPTLRTIVNEAIATRLRLTV